MDEARELQIMILRSWTPGERLIAGFKLVRLAVALRDARIRAQNPGASDSQLRDLRCREALGLAPDEPLPWTS